MGEYLQRVPAEPPQTFQEALNALWICKVALHQENANAALSVGRLDQVLYPFYKKDIKEGRLNPRKAVRARRLPVAQDRRPPARGPRDIRSPLRWLRFQPGHNPRRGKPGRQ